MSEYNLSTIKNEFNEIKEIEKSYIKQKVEKAKEKKQTIYYEEEEVSKILISLDVLLLYYLKECNSNNFIKKEARIKNHSLLEEIEHIRKKEIEKKEHIINIKFIIQNFQVLDILWKYLYLFLVN